MERRQNKMEFSKEYLTDVLDLPDAALEDDIIDTSRWSQIHGIIFKYDDKHYRTSYSIGATEMQDEKPWEFDDFIECEQVELLEKLVKKWMPVNKGE